MSIASEPRTAQKVPISWADIEDDDDFSFPVLNLKEFEADSPSASETDVESTPQRHAFVDDDISTVPSKANRTAEKRVLIRDAMETLSPSRALLASFADITVESTIPYHLKSSVSVSSHSDVEGVDWSAMMHTHDVLEALAAPEKNVRKGRSEVRRSKAVRLLEEALAGATQPIPCDDLAKMVNWNRKFRPAVGCLFSFLKKHRETFAYSKGAVTLQANPLPIA